MLTKKDDNTYEKGKLMSFTERKLRILQAIISDYIKYAEPVGSRNLSKKYDWGISPATIRNEMSDLEEMGYLTHPHTSAGRVPSDKAYRMYVNDLMDKPKLSATEKKAIKKVLSENLNEFDKTMKHAASVLSEITNLASFVMIPTNEEDRLKFIKLLPVDSRTVVMMIVSDAGDVSNTKLRINTSYNEESLQILEKDLTYRYSGKKLTEVLKDKIIKDFKEDAAAMSKLAQNILPSFMRTLEEMLNVELYMEGLVNIFDIPEFSDITRAKEFIKLMSSKEELTRELAAKTEEGLHVTIGSENEIQNLKDCSLITATYHVNGAPVGKIGVIGPKRMQYGEISSIIEYLTTNIEDTFKIKD